MSQETLDLRKFILIIRRHKRLVGVIMVLAILAGAGYGVLYPPLLTSTAQVLLSQSSQAAQTGAQAAANGGEDPYTATQEVIAKSTAVLTGALPSIRPAMSLSDLRRDVEIGSLTPYVISVSVQGKTAAEAEGNANAVAQSYIRYIGSSTNAGGQTSAQLLQSATTTSGLRPIAQTILYAVAGAILGLLLGAIIALTVTRSDRRLRARDEIANSIGVPVIASFPVDHPTDASGWTKLLKEYKPGALHTLQLRRALQQMEMTAADASGGRPNGKWSFTVLSLISDARSLALGPQLAIFAASQGIPTALVISPQQDTAVTAALRTAANALSDRPRFLRVLVTDDDEDVSADTVLTVVVTVIDARNPQIPAMIRTTAALLGVSAGVATADQLARVAVTAASTGREITGIVVADPDQDDATTGRLPHLGRRGYRRMPTRMTGTAGEARR